MKLNPYNIKIRVYCKDEAEARKVQEAISNEVSAFNLIGSELLNFYSKYKQNEAIVRPVLFDVKENGIPAIGKHIPKLLKIK